MNWFSNSKNDALVLSDSEDEIEDNPPHVEGGDSQQTWGGGLQAPLASHTSVMPGAHAPLLHGVHTSSLPGARGSEWSGSRAHALPANPALAPDVMQPSTWGRVPWYRWFLFSEDYFYYGVGVALWLLLVGLYFWDVESRKLPQDEHLEVALRTASDSVKQMQKLVGRAALRNRRARSAATQASPPTGSERKKTDSRAADLNNPS